MLAKNILQNQRFGILTAVSTTTMDGKTLVVCVCDCGDESAYLPDPLRVGKRKRCNTCIAGSVKFNKKVKDISGSQFGKLKVLRPDSSYKGKGTSWICECECGQILSVNQQRFSAGTKTHCGCVAQNYSARKKRESLILIDTIRGLVASKNGKMDALPGQKYRMRFECADGHVWLALIHTINRGHWCSACANISARTKTLDDIRCMASSRGGVSLCEEDPPSTIKKYSWVCTKGHTFDMSPVSVKKGRWCPKCRFKKEELVRKTAEEITGRKFPQKSPKWLVNPATGGRLRFDAYCEEMGVAIEYNGEFHYQEPPYKGSSLKSIKNRDRVKKKLAKAHGVQLITVPYTIKNIKAFLLKRINLEDR